MQDEQLEKVNAKTKNHSLQYLGRKTEFLDRDQATQNNSAAQFSNFSIESSE